MCTKIKPGLRLYFVRRTNRVHFLVLSEFGRSKGLDGSATEWLVQALAGVSESLPVADAANGSLVEPDLLH